jgi:hypothetical protein
VARFDIYPLLHPTLGAGALLTALAWPALALAPFLYRRGIEP